MSEAAADRRLTINPNDISAALAKADHRVLAGDLRAANAFYGSVGRLASQGSAIARSELMRARDTALWLADRFRQMLLAGLDAAGLTAGEMHPRFRESLEIMLGRHHRPEPREAWPQVPLAFYYAGTKYCQFADPATFSWSEALRAATPEIRAEGAALLGGDNNFRPYLRRTSERPQGDVHGLLDNDDWSTCYLTDAGEPIAERVGLCPATWTELNAAVPLCRITTRAPSVMFSLLRAHSRIPPHTGMLNVRLVCHLPLIVPPRCGFRVGGETRDWQVGEPMIFDDTVEHEAWNDSDENRLVLIFDIWRPDISEAERRQIETLFAVVDSS